MIDVAQTLQQTFGFSAFRPGQEEVVDALMQGHHVLAVMPTGGGKSLCYQLPALLNDGLTIVVSPLIALMQNQVAQLQSLGIAAETVNSARSPEEKADIWRRMQRGALQLLYLSPELLSTERVLRAFEKLAIRQIIVDEAHCISQWGHDFRPEYGTLGDLRHRFPDAVIGAFTATADQTTREDIRARLFGEAPNRLFVQGFDRPNIKVSVADKNRPEQQLLRLLKADPGPQGIVYRLSRKKTEATAMTLQDAGYKAAAYHAGLPSHVRDNVLNRFLSEPDLIVVATIAFGMGIDKPDVRFVYHLDLPSNLEAYYQEIGRAGRDGLPAEAMLFYGFDDIRLRRMMIDNSDASDERKRVDHRRLDALLAFTEATGCRKQTLLGYFGEETTPCGKCDRCLDPPELKDASDLARSLFETIERTGTRFGQAHILDIVRGDITSKVDQYGHDRLATFGTLRQHERRVLQSAVRQLYASHFVEVDIEGHGALKLTQKASGVLNGQETVALDLNRHKVVAKPKKRKTFTLPENVDQALLAILKQYRLDLAKERGVPAYIVFTDASLIDMAEKRPSNEAEFRALHGVGERKCEEFAAPFLRLLADYADRYPAN